MIVNECSFSVVEWGSIPPAGAGYLCCLNRSRKTSHFPAERVSRTRQPQPIHRPGRPCDINEHLARLVGGRDRRTESLPHDSTIHDCAGDCLDVPTENTSFPLFPPFPRFFSPASLCAYTHLPLLPVLRRVYSDREQPRGFFPTNPQLASPADETP